MENIIKNNLPRNEIEILNQIEYYTEKGNASKVNEIVIHAIKSGIESEKIISKGLLAGIRNVSSRFQDNTSFIPEVLLSSRAVKIGIADIEKFCGTSSKRKSIVCIGTVKGDIHDIGKNLVKLMIQNKGFRVVDLGTNVSPKVFVEATIENNCKIVCCSALLTTTQDAIGEVVREFEIAKIRDKIKILIGGAPITQLFCNQIGADYYTDNAFEAAELATKIDEGVL